MEVCFGGVFRFLFSIPARVTSGIYTFTANEHGVYRAPDRRGPRYHVVFELVRISLEQPLFYVLLNDTPQETPGRVGG